MPENEIHPVNAALDKLGKKFMGDIMNDSTFEDVIPKTDSFYHMMMFFDSNVPLTNREKMARLMLSSVRAAMYDKAFAVTHRFVRPYRFFTVVIVMAINLVIVGLNWSTITDPVKFATAIAAKQQGKAPSADVSGSADPAQNSRAEIERMMSGR